MTKEEHLETTLEALRLYDANNTCMTVQECAKWLKVHKDTVIRKLHSKDIKGQFIGRVWRIPKMQFLKEIVSQD